MAALALAFGLALPGSVTADAYLANGVSPAAGAGEVEVAAEGSVELVRNGDFQRGAAGWKTTKPRFTTLGLVTGKTGEGVRISTVDEGIGVLKNARSTVVDSAGGVAYEVSAWVRTDVAFTGGHLRVREVSETTTLTHQEWFWLEDEDWHEVNFTFTTRMPDADLAVEILGYRLSPTRHLVVDDLSLRRSPVPGEVGNVAGYLTNGCAFNPRGIPACGAYMGGAHGGNTDPTAWEEQMNHRLGVRRTYWRGDQVRAAVSTAAGDLAYQRLPWISFKLPYSWFDMAHGKGDAWVEDLARRLAELEGPVWLALHHEPEGDGDIQEWRRMQERLAPIVRDVAPNVGYTVILTGWNQLYGAPQFSLSELWPDTTIDVAGFDVFQNYGEVRNGQTVTAIVDLREQYFVPLSEWAEEQGVAWGLAETGYSDIAPDVWPDWPQQRYRELTDLGGVVFSYFDSDLNSIASWDLHDTPSKVAAFTEAIQSTPNLPDRWSGSSSR